MHLGCLRQESSSSGRVAVMAEFVELVRARTAAAHTRVLDTRQKLADNNIDMERVLAALDSKAAAVMASLSGHRDTDHNSDHLNARVTTQLKLLSPRLSATS